MDSTMWEMAVSLTQMGWHVFPAFLDEDGRKRPACAHGFKDATRDEFVLRKLWKEGDRWCDSPFPAVRTGTWEGNWRGLYVVDEDAPGAAAGLDLTGACTAPSKREGGRHHYFGPPADFGGVPCSVLRPKVDLKGDGGYIVFWSDVPEPGELRPLPPSVAALARGGSRASAVGDGGSIPAGRRDVTLASRAGTLRRWGLREAGILDCLRVVNRDLCEPPLDDASLERIARSIGRKPVLNEDERRAQRIAEGLRRHGS